MWWPIESLVRILNRISQVGHRGWRCVRHVPQMQTSTPIHSTVAQSNAPHTLVNGQGQGHMNTQTTTTNQDMVFNLQTIMNDIQSRLTKLN
jgi:hypothetical protein